MNSRPKLAALSVLVLTLLGSHTVQADYEKLINTLESGGSINSEQAQQLRADALTPVVSDSSAISEVEIRGRVQTQFGYVDATNGDSNEQYHTFEVRRVRMGLRGTLLSDVRAQLEADMKPGEEISMTAAFLQWREYKPFYLKMGYDKPHSSFEETTSSTEILTVERSLINEHVAAPGRLNGLALDGEIGVLYYGLGVYTDTENLNEDGQDPRYMTNLLLGFELDDLFADSKLSIQAAYLMSDDPEGEIGEDLGERGIGGLRYSLGPVGLQAEYFLARGDNEESINGWYIMPSYLLTESNQIVLRYEQAHSTKDEGLNAPSRYTRNIPEISDTADEGNKYQSLYLGWNHYLNGNDHKLMGGAEFATLENTTAGDLGTTTLYTAWRMQF